MREELADLAQEQQAFADLLATLDERDWCRPSAAEGWTVRDQVAHLADTEDVAADTLSGGPRGFAAAVAPYRAAEDFTAAGCRRGDSLSPVELTAWWERASARTRALLTTCDEGDRVAWGFGMPARTFAAARQMEHWAHGLDIADALGVPVPESSRLRRVAALGLSSLRYALSRARVAWPSGRTLRLQLSTVDGLAAEFGPRDATDVLRGPMLGWCRVATRRAERCSPAALETNGELAALAARYARAYL